MTDKTDPARAAIQDARALLETMLASDWQDMHVVSGETEIFLARFGGRANPMRAVAPVAVPAVPSARVVLGKEVCVKAPHVATLVSTLPVGRQVAAGETIAVLSVLDEDIALAAPVAGEVLVAQAATGALVEFDTPILTLREAA